MSLEALLRELNAKPEKAEKFLEKIVVKIAMTPELRRALIESIAREAATREDVRRVVDGIRELVARIT